MPTKSSLPSKASALFLAGICQLATAVEGADEAVLVFSAGTNLRNEGHEEQARQRLQAALGWVSCHTQNPWHETAPNNLRAPQDAAISC